LPTQKSYIYALIISALVHLLVILAFKTQPKISALFFPPPSQVLTAESEPPLPVFDLIDLPEQNNSNTPQELVETPEDAAVADPPNDAHFLSDKNAHARDMYTGDDLKKGLPYNEGETLYKVFAGGGTGGQSFDLVPLPQTQPSQPAPAAPSGNESEAQVDENGNLMIPESNLKIKGRQYQPFSREMLLGTRARGTPGPAGFSDDASWNNRESSADDLGGVSLSTYAWDFAPYVFYLKKRIREHIYPPPAFYQIGAISGESVLRFRIYPDGSMSDLSVLNYTGHKALVETSVNAVRASSPFRPLPQDFSEPYLELVWTFIYSVY
jgi:hypothetical protein